MKVLIEWLGSDKKRTRIAVTAFTAIVWFISILISYGLITMGKDSIAILSLVTAQFAAIIGFYMTTNAETD